MLGNPSQTAILHNLAYAMAKALLSIRWGPHFHRPQYCKPRAICNCGYIDFVVFYLPRYLYLEPVIICSSSEPYTCYILLSYTGLGAVYVECTPIWELALPRYQCLWAVIICKAVLIGVIIDSQRGIVTSEAYVVVPNLSGSVLRSISFNLYSDVCNVAVALFYGLLFTLS